MLLLPANRCVCCCCRRVDGMSDWINNVEKLMKEMGQENISSDEYKDMLARFQVSHPQP